MITVSLLIDQVYKLCSTCLCFQRATCAYCSDKIWGLGRQVSKTPLDNYTLWWKLFSFPNILHGFYDKTNHTYDCSPTLCAYIVIMKAFV